MNMDIEKVAAAIEADAGESLPELRQALVEARSIRRNVTTAEQLLARHAHQKPGPMSQISQTLYAKSA